MLRAVGIVLLVLGAVMVFGNTVHEWRVPHIVSGILIAAGLFLISPRGATRVWR